MVNYHYSDVRAYTTCPKLFYQRLHFLPAAHFSFTQMQMSLKDALIQKLKCTDFVVGERGMDASISLKWLDEYEWIINARFEFQSLRVKVPALHKTNHSIDVYFSSMSSYPKMDDRHYFSSVLWVLENSGLSINKVFVVYFNPYYVRKEQLDIDECFLISSNFLKVSGHIQGDIKEMCSKRNLNYESSFAQMNEIRNMDGFDMELMDCPLGNRCSFFKACFPHISEQPYQIAQKLLNRFEHPENYSTALSRSDYAQLQVHLNKERFVDHLALRNWIRTYDQAVISFVDFEWDSYGIPPYEGMKPFDVLCFQYSLHILDDNDLQHKEFLGDGDTRRLFIENLIKDLPKIGPIFAYNAYGAEVIRLKELAQQFPEYKEFIDQMIPRFVDLATLFISGVIYDEKMEGQYSLKQLIKVIDPSLTYENLAISHGMEAVQHYRMMQDEESDEITRDALLSYCRMDTYAMVKVFEWVKKLGKES